MNSRSYVKKKVRDFPIFLTSPFTVKVQSSSHACAMIIHFDEVSHPYL